MNSPSTTSSPTLPESCCNGHNWGQKTFFNSRPLPINNRQFRQPLSQTHDIGK
ncbi:hypothetical protein [Phormidium sp. CCY1219]|uniref:hypothetical protein n=1 Tax=Phormidium sp. CCY1219 TaxID=2886104 RepID=UPI002D1F97FD|nr:hypothetical protein [Phormidium sp. CCY1219]MEB3827555.1 hypothetical protein [Phormidium sp. CCY1219]